MWLVRDLKIDFAKLQTKATVFAGNSPIYIARKMEFDVFRRDANRK